MGAKRGRPKGSGRKGGDVIKLLTQKEPPIGHVEASTRDRDAKNLERLQESRPLRPPGRA